MSDIVNKIKSIEKLYQAKGCSFKQLKDAQNELGLSFPEEFIDYVKHMERLASMELNGLD